jgi:electron transfer flavoprotein alpha subunit
MASLVIAEHDNKSLKDPTAKTVTAAAQVSTPVHVLVAGSDCSAAADEATKLAGVEKVLIVDAPLYAHAVAEPMEALILSLASNYDAILAPATTSGKNFLPRVAAKLDVPQISEITKVVSPDTFERPIYAGNAIATVQAADGKKVITVRTTAFKAAQPSGSAQIEKVSAAPNPEISHFVGEQLSKSERPELTSAKIIISGGRGMQSGENFHLLE